MTGGIISEKAACDRLYMVKGKIKKQRILYTCDICGRPHKDLAAAKKCEVSHNGTPGGIKKILGRLFARGSKQ